MIFVYSTFPNKSGAKRVGEGILRKRLAACVVTFPIDSMYWWDKRIVREKEFAMIIKTKKENFSRIEKFILKNHSYDTPCILEIPVGRVTPKYLKWLVNIVRHS